MFLAVVSKSCLLSLHCSFLLKGKAGIISLLNAVILVLFFAVCCLCFLFERIVNRKCYRSTESVFLVIEHFIEESLTKVKEKNKKKTS